MVANGIPLDIVDWVVNFLSDRNLCLGKSSIRVFNGLPQGSCLSPILFNLYSASLHRIEDDNTLVFQFAGDFMILSFDRDFEIAVENLSRKILEFGNDCHSLNLSFNIRKTKVAYFAKGGRRSVQISVNGCTIEQVSSLTFLGRKIKNSLSVKEHYDFALGNCNSAVNLLKCLTSIKGGLMPEVSLKFYRSFIRSKIEYARTTTAHSPTYIDNRIRSFQNSTLRRCLGLTPSTPVHIIYAMACELPPDLRAIYLTAKELFRVFVYNPPLFRLIATNRGLNNSYSFVFSKFSHIFDRLGKCVRSSISVKVTFKLDNPFGCKHNAPRECTRAYYGHLLREYKENGFRIMATDGSLSDSSVGCAIVLEHSDRFFLFRCNMRLSSLTAELIAIREALVAAATDGFERVAILTDSRNAIISLRDSKWEDYIVSEIIQIIADSSMRAIHFIWVPSHMGIPINERADELARMALDCGAPLQVDYSVKWALKLIRDELQDEWNHSYSEISQSKGNFYFSFNRTISLKPWYRGFALDPGEVKIINRLLTGHAYDKKFLNLIRNTTPHFCRSTLWK
ncbi:uncharacterized protein LOC119610484 [Lucilia sericata]|uniref:uncharacterized protein LOC119610484 n=1 Tax=Lucilia sericata TaxID=13632 RepID=UPI0018A871E1|nr:uncharacterized protein LOC119610484 [Lucilia sericata]